MYDHFAKFSWQNIVPKREKNTFKLITKIITIS